MEQFKMTSEEAKLILARRKRALTWEDTADFSGSFSSTGEYNFDNNVEMINYSSRKKADYNGWTNEDTYGVAGTVDNDYAVYDALLGATSVDDFRSIALTSTVIPSWVNLDNVNWQEIFDNFEE